MTVKKDKQRLSADLQADEPDGDLGFNSALARGFQVLRSFETGDTFLGNKDLAARTGIPKATVSRLTATLCKLGYLKLSPDTQKYQIAPSILSLAHAVLARMAIRAKSLQGMVQLANEADAIVTLGTYDSLSAINIQVAEGPNAINRGLSIGLRVPLTRSATGLACLAAMRPAQREAVLEGLSERDPEAWPATKTHIDEAMESFWRQGFYVSLGEFDPMMNSVSVPYFDSRDGEIYSFACIGPAFRFTEKLLRDQWGPRLLSLVSTL